MENFVKMLLFTSLLSATLSQQCSHFAYQSEVPQPGMHVVCALQQPNRTLYLNILKNGKEETELRFHKDHGRIEDLILFLYDRLGTTNSRSALQWRAYSTTGESLISIDDLIYEETSLLYTNGLFLWPGVRVGFVQPTPSGDTLETLSLSPLLFRVPNFLGSEECDHIQEGAAPHLVASPTAKMDHDVDKPDTTWRTSMQYFLTSDHSETIRNIDKRVAKLTNLPVSYQESCQVLRYEEGQHYGHHNDYFDPEFYQSDPNTLKNIRNGEHNRLLTLLWYLSDVTSGGETIFPLSNGKKPSNQFDCSDFGAIKVIPRKGEAILFYNMHADGTFDKRSLHGACPVGRGEVKWAANKWVWTGPA